VAVRQLGLSAVIAARQEHGAATDLVRMPATGGATVNLTADWDLLPAAPRVHPDGRVSFSAGIGGETHLFQVDATGGPVRQVSSGARRLSGFSFAQSSDRVAYLATDPTHPNELFVARGDGSAERRLTAFNDAWLQNVTLASPERLRYSSRDGTPVEGWLIRPGPTNPGARWPLVVAIHGGPHGAYGADFSFQFQYLAANGYGVLYTNPRGSTGYGERFLWGTWGAWETGTARTSWRESTMCSATILSTPPAWRSRGTRTGAS
jgi:dipeptidyl aminopeptidase/acylaminoacyl peptidase